MGQVLWYCLYGHQFFFLKFVVEYQFLNFFFPFHTLPLHTQTEHFLALLR